MELSVYKIDGTESGKKVTLDAEIFGIEPNNHAIYLDVKQYLANQRQGTHKTKEKWEVARSTKKIIRQKGSGGARHGSTKSPTMVGGGRAFGPQPRDYRFKLNKKLKQLARFSALSYKAQENAITLVEPFAMEAPKTKEFVQILKNVNAAKKALVVTAENNENVIKSAKNIEGVATATVNTINVYDILKYDSFIITTDAVKKVEEVYA
jgi:large subunit ribosomal protein L4